MAFNIHDDQFAQGVRSYRLQPDRDSLPLFERVLALFLRDPADKANLHRGPARWLARIA